MANNPASVPPDLYYVHNDHLGTPQVLTDEAGTVVWQASYDPFGKATVDEDPDGDTKLVSLNVRFPGQYFDTETGLHYNYFRYYDPETGRYVTSDPIGLDGGLNTYAYVGGNPTNNTDPSGLICGTGVCIGTAIGVGNLLRTIGTGVAIGLGASTPVTNQSGDNVIPFPDNNPTSPNQCGPEDNNPEDPCERAQKTLQRNRDLFMQSVRTIKDAGVQAKQIRDFAKLFNPIVKQHNLACPGHRVAPIPVGPGPIS